MQKISLKWKLIIGFAIPLAMILVISATVYRGLEDMLDSNYWVNHTYEAISLGENIGASLVDMETGLRGYLVSGKENFLEPYHAGKANFERLVAQSKKKVSDNSRQVKRLEEVEKLHSEWQTNHVKVAMDYREEVNQGVAASNYFKTVSARTVGKKMFDSFRASLAELQNYFIKNNDEVGEKIMLNILIDMINQETGQRGFLLTGKEESLEPYVAGISSFAKNSKALEEHIANKNYPANIAASATALKKSALGWKSGAADPEIQARRDMNRVSRSMEDITAFIEKGIGKAYMDNMREVLKNFIDEEAGLILGRNEKQISTADFTESVAVLGSLLALLIGVLLTALITRNVLRELGDDPSELRLISDQIADGKFKVDIDVNDSTGVLNSMARMKDSLQQRHEQDRQIQKEIDTLVESASRGDFTKTIKTDGKDGVFLNVSLGLNRLVETCNRGLTDINQVLGAIAQGDLTQSITADYEGAFLELKNSSNNTISKLQQVMGEIKDLVNAANQGDFSQEIELSKKSGFFRDISQELNQLVDTTRAGLGDAVQLMQALQKGDLSQAIEGQYEGLFLELKDYSNQTIEQMKTVMVEIDQLVDAANSGDFTRKIHLEGKDGFFLSLSNNLNQLVDTTNNGLNDVMRILEALANGDLSQSIDRHYEGTFGQLKDYSNNTVSQINEVMSEIGTMIDSANQGDFSGEIRIDGKSGFFKELSENLNVLMTTTGTGLQDMLTILEGLAKGDLTQSIDSDYTGPYQKLKDYANDTVGKIKQVMDEVNRMLSNANNGDFSSTIALSGKTGFFYDLSDGLNQLASTTEKGLGDIITILRSLANGDLSNRITNNYQGAFGELRDNANATADKLAEVIDNISRSSEVVINGVNELNAGNQQLNHRTEDQVRVLESTASGMEEMLVTVNQNADNAENARKVAEVATEKAIAGGKTVQDAVKGMAEISTSSNKINDIISVIDDIAFQTNLLALNAAVEAARAGEQGRGFAVVASEVRTLAQRSAAAAKEIGLLINVSVDKVNDGSALVNRCGETLEEIMTSVKNVNEMVSQISTASREQAQGISEINDSIGHMDSMTQQNAALVEESSSSSITMKNQVDEMKEMMAFFKS